MSRKKQPEIFFEYEKVEIYFPLFLKSFGTITNKFRVGEYEEFYLEESTTYYKYYSDKKRETISFNKIRGQVRVGLNFGVIEQEDEEYLSWLRVFKTKCQEITEDEYTEAFKSLIKEHENFSGRETNERVEDNSIKAQHEGLEDCPF